jgi:hypothetical protein
LIHLNYNGSFLKEIIFNLSTYIREIRDEIKEINVEEITRDIEANVF